MPHHICRCDACIDVVMMVARIGHDHGLDLALARIHGAVEYQPLSLEYVEEQLTERSTDGSST